jgi:hypothetical protein
MLDHPFRGLIYPLMAILIGTILCVAVAATANYFVHGAGGLVVAAILGALAAIVLLWFADRRYELGFANDLALVFPQFAAYFGFFARE